MIELVSLFQSGDRVLPAIGVAIPDAMNIKGTVVGWNLDLGVYMVQWDDGEIDGFRATQLEKID